MATYMLRKIDDDLWRRFRQRAAADGRLSLRDLILELMQRYADRPPDEGCPAVGT